MTQPSESPGTAASSGVEIHQVHGRKDLKAFIEVPVPIYLEDPCWVRPLIFERLEHLDPAKNPYFQHADAAYWIARRGGRDLGRISAQVNRAHLERHEDATGHFGFLEAVDDREVFQALLGTAERWLSERGMKRIAGPFSLSINEESGLLVEGFDSPPYLMMGHARPYYATHLEGLGYQKLKDLYAYLYDVTNAPPAAAVAFLERMRRNKKITFRHLDKRRFNEELAAVLEIFNDAWSENWGFLPFTKDQIDYAAKNLRHLLRPEDVAIAEIDGESVAMTVGMPNVNEVIADLHGRLLPLGWAKILWRLKVSNPSSGRLALMGVKRRFQNTPLGAALALGVIEEIRTRHKARGTRWAELSWVLEDNIATRKVIETAGGKPYKTYRIFAKDLP